MRALGSALVLVLTLAACGQQQESATGDGANFVAGDGSLVLLDESERGEAPSLSGTTLDGQVLDLGDFAGDIVVLNVWASWCAPCRAEAPVLAEVSADLADDGVQFIGLNTRDSQAAAQSFAGSKNLDFPHLVDADGRLQLLFADTLPPQAIPSTVVIDSQGRVAARALGAVSESSLRGLIEPLIAERDSSAGP